MTLSVLLLYKTISGFSSNKEEFCSKMADKSTYSTKTIFDKVADKVLEQIVNQTISANDGNIQFQKLKLCPLR